MGIKKELGKITKVAFGHGGYQDAMLGVQFYFEGQGWGCGSHMGFWAPSIIDCSEYAEWTEESRDAEFVKVMRYIDDLLSKAKKRNLADLKGLPVEVTFESNTLKDWRILTEVL